jgi:MoxR-like ATPase
MVAIEDVKSIHISVPVKRYIVDLTTRTRHSSDIYLGASPRGSLALARASQAFAAMVGRDFVLPDDAQQLAMPVLSTDLSRPDMAADLTGSDRTEISGNTRAGGVQIESRESIL